MTPVVTTPAADENIRHVDDWWMEHRPLSPHLFREELAEGLALLADAPEVGRRYAHRGIPGLRRIVLRATRYHAYYVYDGRLVTVLSVWSSLRRRGPKLAPP